MSEEAVCLYDRVTGHTVTLCSKTAARASASCRRPPFVLDVWPELGDVVPEAQREWQRVSGVLERLAAIVEARLAKSNVSVHCSQRGVAVVMQWLLQQ